MNVPIVSYGEIDLDLYLSVNRLPAVNVASSVKQEFSNVGGAAGNTAIWLAHWGIPVRLLGHELGDDADGIQIREQLARYPMLDSQYVYYRKGEKTPRCQCLVTPDGERTFILHGLEDLVVTPLTPEMLEGIRWLNLDMSGPLEPRLEAARLAHKQNIPILVNDIYDLDHPLLGLVDIIIMSAAIMRTKISNYSVQAFAKALHDKAECDVIITDGIQAVQAFLKTGEQIMLRPLQVSVIDTTGAGDIFKAGLLYGLLQDLPMKQTLKWALAAGAAKVGCAGTTAKPAPLSDIQVLFSQVT